MFRSLSKIFDKKKKLIESSNIASLGITRIINQYIVSNFNNQELIKLMNYDYKDSDKLLTITCPDKIIANEIFIRQKEVKDILTREGYSDVKLVIK